MMKKPTFTSHAETAIGVSVCPPRDARGKSLGATAIRNAPEHSSLGDGRVDDVIMGHDISPGEA
jgi:hypothetical protein